MAYGKSKNLAKRTQPDKVLRYKTFETAVDLKYDGYEIELASMVYKFCDKGFSESGVPTLANKAVPNCQLTNELHRQIVRKFKRRKVYSSFGDNIWSVDLAHGLFL